MFAKIEVNGPNTCEVYKFLRRNSELYDDKKKQSKEIPWNFAKFLVDGQGKVISYHNPKIDAIAMVKDIEALLK